MHGDLEMVLLLTDEGVVRRRVVEAFVSVDAVDRWRSDNDDKTRSPTIGVRERGYAAKTLGAGEEEGQS